VRLKTEDPDSKISEAENRGPRLQNKSRLKKEYPDSRISEATLKKI